MMLSRADPCGEGSLPKKVPRREVDDEAVQMKLSRADPCGEGSLPKIEIFYFAPFRNSTAGIVRRRMLRSSQSDQLSM